MKRGESIINRTDFIELIALMISLVSIVISSIRMISMNRIRLLRSSCEMKQSDLAKQLNVRQNTISNWETGRSEPDFATLQKMARIFDTTIDYILGNSSEKSPANLSSIVQIPVLGSIPAGIPLEAIEDIVDWEDIPKAMCSGGKEFFALKVKGDSMWPDFLEGDIVILRKTPSCETGDVCAVLVNGDEATLKTVKFAEDGSLTITPKNPSYPPKTFTPEQIRQLPVSIAGVVVELRRTIK